MLILPAIKGKNSFRVKRLRNLLSFVLLVFFLDETPRRWRGCAARFRRWARIRVGQPVSQGLCLQREGGWVRS